ncbi:MAG: DUF262 domain-containing protein [Clostridia bacterium]|nr:DUF262 domain-containing protein [Clostridia bacterium]MBR4577776.1 DUF262 domain-containing protein [Clostridia bacterium]
MSKLNIDQQTIYQLFSDKKSDFLIPDYQRPYAWGETECQTLWDDIFAFSFPDDSCDKFNPDDEYFLGPIVTYKNERKLEIIDGQQRLTTLMLMLRAFYTKFLNMKDDNSQGIRNSISKCIWKTDEFGNLKMDQLKIDSQVSTDDDKEEFMTILRTGEVKKEYKSKYASVFRFFVEKIEKFCSEWPSYAAYLPARIMNNCILLPIEAETQDTALRIFSTLNDRGLPLSDSDIFKAQFYKIYSAKGEKDLFIEKWKDLEALAEKIFHPLRGTPMDELFTRYMYYERAKQGISSSTTEALRRFYEKDSYKLLKTDGVFDNLIGLANFWNDVSNQNNERFSYEILRKLYVLNYAPNGMWTYFVSVYYMQNKDADGMLEDEAFLKFLDKTIAFVWTYAVTNPGVNMLRTPIYAEMINIVNNIPVEFKENKFDLDAVRNRFELFDFYNMRPITKAMLTWWAYTMPEQPLFPMETVLEIEHIYARNRNEKETTNPLSNPRYVEKLGNKALLEKRVNIRASDYRFADKANYYKGYINKRGQVKEGTKVVELRELAETNADFTEKDILNRQKIILDAFINYLRDNDLAK